MAIPDYQTLMLPVLQLAADGQEHKFAEAVEQLAQKFGLTDEERTELLPSGTQAVFNNRVGWARSYLKQARLLEAPKRGYFRISERGKGVLAKNPTRIDVDFLAQYPEFIEFRSRKKEKNHSSGVTLRPTHQADTTESPEDSLASAYLGLQEALEAEVLDAVMDASPTFFERLVVDLLVKMGYGGDRQDAGKAIGKSGDGGIDGIIKEDQLGLDVIYIQAKRWDGTVGRPEIQRFAGALQGQHAKKGVFITTSSFSNEAVHYASSIETRIILIDGAKLAKLMGAVLGNDPV